MCFSYQLYAVTTALIIRYSLINSVDTAHQIGHTFLSKMALGGMNKSGRRPLCFSDTTGKKALRFGSTSMPLTTRAIYKGRWKGTGFCNNWGRDEL